jgi:hypothetical protein
MNAAISAAVVLASRLHEDLSSFALVLFAVQLFALFPILRHRLQVGSPRAAHAHQSRSSYVRPVRARPRASQPDRCHVDFLRCPYGKRLADRDAPIRIGDGQRVLCRARGVGASASIQKVSSSRSCATALSLTPHRAQRDTWPVGRRDPQGISLSRI